MTHLVSAEPVCRHYDDPVDTGTFAPDSPQIGLRGPLLRQPCRTVNRFFLLLCILCLAAPHHLNFCSREPSPIFSSTMRFPPRAESLIQGDYPCCSRSFA